MSRRAVIAMGLLLLLAARADATLDFGTSWELGFGPQPSPTPDTNSGLLAPVGNPQLVTSGLATVPGVNRYARQYAAPAGTAVYDRWALPSRTAPRLSKHFTLTNCIPGTNRTILAFANPSATGHYTQGCLAVVRYASTLFGTHYCTVSAFYGDPAQKVCSGALDNDKRCTDLTECQYNNADEAQCTNTAMATSDILPEGADLLVTLTQDNATGAVTCGLYSGTGNTPALAYNSGNATRVVGYCAGGANANEPCTADSACPASTCTVTDVFALTEARSGVLDTTGTTVLTVTDDQVIGYTGDILQNWYLSALDVVSQGIASGSTNWVSVGTAGSCGDGTSLYHCLVPPADGDSSAAGNQNAAKPTAVFGFATPVLPTAIPSPSPKALLVHWTVKHHAGGASGTTAKLVPMVAGTTTPNPAPSPFAFTSLIAGGGSAPYYVAPPAIWERAFTFAELGGLTVELNKTAGSGNEGRVGTMIAEVLYQTANPTIPAVIPDRDRDTKKTACFAWDSTGDNVDFQNALVAALHEPDNLCFYTRGGARLGDIENEWPEELEGAAGTFMGLEVRRGTSGATCDVMVNEGGLLNVMGAGPIGDPTVSATFHGIGQGGYCEDLGGADQGNDCYCDPKLDNWTSQWGTGGATPTPAPNVTPAVGHCINNGDFAANCSILALKGHDCACATNADCVRGNDGQHGTCSGGKCVGTGLGDCSANALSNQRLGFCAPGCVNAPGCATGVCVRSFGLAAVEAGFANLDRMTALRPTPAATPPLGGKPIVVAVAPPPGIGLSCWMDTKPAAGAIRQLIRTRAKANGTPYIDLWARTYQQCTVQLGSDQCTTAGGCSDTENVTKCYRDAVHGTYKWQALVAAPAIAECLTNSVSGASVTHDGVCTATVCTRGLSGDGCATDSDCDTWSCDFGAQS